ncbi:TPA: hypothetical protein ACSRG0_005060 [Klebsiella pneumoniae]
MLTIIIKTSVFFLQQHLLAKQIINEDLACVSASQTALFQVRYSLIPGGTGFASLSHH